MALPSVASANGRFPRAERLVEDPRDAQHLILGATYGLLTTRDRGQSWSYICEASFSGIDQYVGDPLADLADDGTLLVGVQVGINTSSDLGCSFTPAFGGPGRYVPDFAVGEGPGSSIVAVVAASEEGGVVVRLVESSDRARTFHPLGVPVPIGVAYTIDMAPSDPNRLYVSGLTKTNAPVLLVSSDHGSTWSSHAITSGADERPFIAAIDRRDPQKVYVRTVSSTTDNGLAASNDALFVTTDGGTSWREVFRAPAQALGFALSPDGATVLIGYGDPMDGDLVIDSSALGIYRSSTTEFAFTRLSTTSTTCLAWTKTGIYACTSPLDTGYTVAFADAKFGADGGGLEPLLSQGEVRGPPECCMQKGVCASAWSSACVIFGSCDAGAPAAGAACLSEAGAPPSGADGGAAGTREIGRQNGGCGCRVGAASTAKKQWMSMAMLAALLAVRRRRPAPAPRRAPQASVRSRAPALGSGHERR